VSEKKRKGYRLIRTVGKERLKCGEKKGSFKLSSIHGGVIPPREKRKGTGEKLLDSEPSGKGTRLIIHLMRKGRSSGDEGGGKRAR